MPRSRPRFAKAKTDNVMEATHESQGPDSDDCPPTSDANTAEVKLPGSDTTLCPDDLDNTMVDTLISAERSALDSLQQHENAVAALRDRIQGIWSQGPGKASLAELRLMLDEAKAVEKLVNIPAYVLASPAIAQAAWQLEDVNQAREMLGLVDSNDEIAARCRGLVEQNGSVLFDATLNCDAMEDLLHAWLR